MQLKKSSNNSVIFAWGKLSIIKKKENHDARISINNMLIYENLIINKLFPS
jgi:hypothetical protein